MRKPALVLAVFAVVVAAFVGAAWMAAPRPEATAATDGPQGPPPDQLPPPEPVEAPPQAGIPPGDAPDPDKLPLDQIGVPQEKRPLLPPEMVGDHPPPAGETLTPEQLRELVREGKIGADPTRLRPDQIGRGGDLRLRPGQIPPEPESAPPRE